MSPRTKAFSQSKQGISIRKELIEMASSKEYGTPSSYSPDGSTGLSFVEKHMKYMSQYQNMNYQLYVSNLKLRQRS
jgi:hypothetical protein